MTESAAQQLLAAIEQRLSGDSAADLDSALSAFRHRATEFVRRYHRLDIDREVGSLDTPVLFVPFRWFDCSVHRSHGGYLDCPPN